MIVLIVASVSLGLKTLSARYGFFIPTMASTEGETPLMVKHANGLGVL